MGGGGAAVPQTGPAGVPLLGDIANSIAAAKSDADEVFRFTNQKFGNAPGVMGMALPPMGGEVGQVAPAAGGDLTMQDGAVAWSAPGGLSLPFTLPQEGQKLTYSKSGGDAKLALGLRSDATVSTATGLAWTLLWLVAAIVLIALLGRADSVRRVAAGLPLLAAIGGLVWLFVLPGEVLAFLVFFLGLVALAWQHRQRT